MYYNESVEVNSVDGLRKHFVKTYGWMAIGVLISFGVGFFLTTTGMIFDVMEYVFIVLIAQLGVGFAMIAGRSKMGASALLACFLIYAAMLGVTISTLSFAYDLGTLIQAFVAATVFFVCLAVIGTTTKMDLSKIGTIAVAGLFAMIIFSLVSMLFGFSFDTLTYSIIGLLLFVVITAWDAQKCKKIYFECEGDEQMLKKASINSAFMLYLDFINMFIYLVRIFGNRR